MQDYSWMRAKSTPKASPEAIANFRLAQADMHDRIAEEWEGRDEVQAQRWRASAALLRGEG